LEILKNKIFPEILDKKRIGILTSLGSLPFCRNFYLAGGTALALQIGHRISLDFDFFSPVNSLNRPDREKIKRQIKKLTSFKIITDEENTLDITIKNIQTSFFNYPYPSIGKPMLFKKIKIASIEDIALMKLAAATSRGSKKDFIDLYFILREIPLERLFLLAKKKFTRVKDFRIQTLRGITYFNDAEAEKTPKMIKRVSWETVKNFLKKQAIDYLKPQGIGDGS